jgi:hypothetical protein
LSHAGELDNRLACVVLIATNPGNKKVIAGKSHAASLKHRQGIHPRALQKSKVATIAFPGVEYSALK